MKAIESSLFMHGKVNLRGMALISDRTSVKKTGQLLAKLKKQLYKELKKATGASKENIRIELDSIALHPENKVKLLLWDRSDEDAPSQIKYLVQSENIVPPLLPTYKQSTIIQSGVDMATREFKRFWKNILLNHKAGHSIKLIIESSTSHHPDPLIDKEKYMIAREVGEAAKLFIQERFKEATGRELEVMVRSVVHGPPFNNEFEKYVDYKQFEYINFIPIVHNRQENEEPRANPYQVNFDYFFNGIDTSSLVFNNFARYIARSVEKDGYVELRIESSISQIPIERRKSNLYIAYSRSYESQKRLKEQLKRKLVDENRIIFTEERNLIQGPPYDGQKTILSYRQYQYLRIIPEKFLKP